MSDLSAGWRSLPYVNCKKLILHVEIVWRAFELRPELVPTLDPNGEYLHRVWSSSVYPLAERLNIRITASSGTTPLATCP